MNKTGFPYLEILQKEGVITHLELEFARFLKELDPGIQYPAVEAGTACVNAQLNGHICLDLEQVRKKYLFGDPQSGKKVNHEIIESWLEALSASLVVGSPGELKPLILQENRLYLQKYLKFEEELAAWIRKKAEVINVLSSEDKKIIAETAGELGKEINWQQVAVCIAFLKDLVIISGGPGTGKTHTVLNILTGLVQREKDEKYDIALAAPTGKAAQRLAQSLKAGLENLSIPKSLRDRIPEEASTVHRLLGADFRGANFKYNEERKLPNDIIVIDEASMLDITMWVKLIRAVKENAKLIVLGDKDQLASVEAGSILGDLCGGENSFSSMAAKQIKETLDFEVTVNNNLPGVNDSQVFLTKSYRFSGESGIQQLAVAINRGNDDEALALLESGDFPDIKRVDTTGENINAVLQDFVLNHYKEYTQHPVSERLEAVNNKKILCALRKGPFGVEKVNQLAELQLKKANHHPAAEEWYEGRPVLASRNDPVLKIRNGETGVCVTENKSEFIFFGGETIKKVLKSRLRDYEPGFAATIHKSQGSEFNHVAILLPNQENPILSKELLYTSVTRARQSLLVIGNKEILRQSIQRNIFRNSGLKQKVWG